MKFLFLLILLISCSTISVAETIGFSAYPIKKTEIFNFTSSDIKLKDHEFHPQKSFKPPIYIIGL